MRPVWRVRGVAQGGRGRHDTTRHETRFGRKTKGVRGGRSHSASAARPHARLRAHRGIVAPPVAQSSAAQSTQIDTGAARRGAPGFPRARRPRSHLRAESAGGGGTEGAPLETRASHGRGASRRAALCCMVCVVWYACVRVLRAWMLARTHARTHARTQLFLSLARSTDGRTACGATVLCTVHRPPRPPTPQSVTRSKLPASQQEARGIRRPTRPRQLRAAHHCPT